MVEATRVKVCGLTRLEDAKFALNLGAWGLGFIFHKKSPRYINPVQVSEILKSLGPSTRSIGVFVDVSIEEVLKTVHTSGVMGVQLHGDESTEYCFKIRDAFTECLLIKAFQPQQPSDLSQLMSYAMCDHLLIDHFDKKERGGTGKVSDWALALEAKKQGSVILAGGLSAENVKAAIAQVNPFALDVSSLLESSPGIKDHNKMSAFFAKVTS